MGWIADLLKEIPSAARYKSELEAMERENVQLKTQIQVCQSEVEKLRQEIQRRDNVIQKEKSHDNLLEEIKVNILLFMSKHEETYVHNIAQSLNVGLQVAQFHLEELQDTDFVNSSFIIGG